MLSMLILTESAEQYLPQSISDTSSRAVPGIFLPCEIAGRARNDELQSPNFLSL